MSGVAYVDIESLGAKYRLVVVTHTDKVSSSQLPQNFSAVLLEGVAINSQTLQDALAGASRLWDNPMVFPFVDIRFKAKERRIPVVAAEPLGNLRANVERHNRINSTEGSFFKNIIGLPLILAGRTSREIKIGSFYFKFLERICQRVEKKDQRTQTTLLRLRNNLIAQRAFAFAEFQKTQNIEPSLVVAAGALHLGILRAIQTGTDERVESILADVNLAKYFHISRLHQGFYVQYDEGKERWINRQFEDKRLKVIGLKSH